MLNTTIQKKAQSLHGEFVQAMKMLAKEFKMWIIFGMNEQTVDETKTTIQW